MSTKTKTLTVNPEHRLSFQADHKMFRLRMKNAAETHLGYFKSKAEAVKVSLMTPVERATFNVLNKLAGK